MTSQFSDMKSSSIFWRCFVSLVKFSYWSKFHVSIITGSGIMTIFFYKGLTRNPEIPPSEFCPISGDWGELWIPNLAQMSLIECYWMLQNSRVMAFTVFELLRENKKKYSQPSQISQIFQISVYFLVKKSPLSFSATTLWDPKIWGLRSCHAPPFWKFSKRFNLPNPQQKWRRGAHCEFCLNVNMMAQLI